MNLDDLPAGREMDALVAEKVMGWERWDGRGDYAGHAPVFFADWGGPGVAVYKLADESGDVDRYFAPSADMAAAWQVVEKLHAVPDSDGYEWARGHYFDLSWGASHFDADSYEWRVSDRVTEAVARAETAPLAICRAALKAVNATRPEQS